MACNCKHNENEIERFKIFATKLRELFVKRMTVDSEHSDRRKRDFNQAIFCYKDDKKDETFAIWDDIDIDMVLQCFDNAVSDYHKSLCDVKSCRRK